jgi:hypothetical protein
MSQRRREDGPAVEDRWWVDTGKATERSRAAATGERPPIGTRFFDIGYEFDQERARTRLTDVNLKFLEEAAPEAGEWKIIQMVPHESVPPAELERLKARLPLPPRARGVIVDSGRSVRFIITGDPVGERVLEFTLGEESSFDCWVRGDWVREELFDSLDDALRKAKPYLRQYLESQPDRW